jgi:hypothetical protein
VIDADNVRGRLQGKRSAERMAFLVDHQGPSSPKLMSRDQRFNDLLRAHDTFDVRVWNGCAPNIILNDQSRWLNLVP